MLRSVPNPGPGRAGSRVKEVSTDFKLISSETHQAFGAWSGRVQDEAGGWVRVADVFGWAEDVRQRW